METLQLPEDLEYPKIRAVEAIPTEQNGEPSICLRDPLSLARNVLFVPPALFYILTLFDGTRSIADIQADILKRTQERIPRRQLENLVRQLDQELFLESENLRRAVKEQADAYRRAPVRPAAFAGGAYASEPEALQRQLQEYRNAMRSEAPRDLFAGHDQRQLCALVSPHIDLHRGGKCFAYAYEEIARREPADLYLIFGTGHHLSRSRMVLTRKSYQTPLGVVETDLDFVERLSRRAPLDFFQEEILHRNEHSIEFQTLWLRYLLGDRWQGKIVPILCGSLHAAIHKGCSPRTDKRLAETLDVLREMIADYPGRVTVIAGADLSHVGKRFGHPNGIPPEERQRVEREDAAVIDAMLTGSAESFFNSIARVKDYNNVCGLSPIYMMLDVTRPSQGKRLNYAQAIEQDTESLVSYASLSFFQ